MAAEPDPAAPAPEPRTRVPLALERVLLAGCMAAMALITFGNVVTRYLSNISLAFTEEYSVALMVVVALLGTSLATAAGRHVRIGTLVDGLAPPASSGRGGGSKDESAELRELRRRNKLLEQENEILRRATAYFARDVLPK